MIKWRLVRIFICCGVISSAPAQSVSIEKLPALLDRMTSKNHGYGGGVFRVSDRRGVLWEGAAGRMAGPASPPMQTDTPFEIASVTKMVTATIVLMLVEQGKLRLDSRLADVLPARLANGFQDISVQQLLSHTSGLPDYWDDRSRPDGFLRAFTAEPGRRWEPEGILSYARQMRIRSPGNRFKYSDTNYVLLGLVIEHITSRPLHRAFREMIFEPLGMNDTWLSYRETPRGLAPSHRFEGGEDLHAVPRQSADWAGGGLVCTTRDLEKLLRGMVTGGLFKNAGTLDIMRKSVPTGSEGIGYGMGVYCVDLGGGAGEMWGHDGHGNAFAYYWPERGLYFTGTLNQTENDWWPLVEIFCDEGDAGILAGGERKPLDAEISTGWDSLYMFRGVNALRDGNRYGAGIAWTGVNLAWNPGENDRISLDLWNCFSTQGTAYREFDATLAYTRAFGGLELGCAYAFYFGYAPENFSSHELSVVAAHELELGRFTLIPSLGYFFNIGPDSADGQGSAKAATSYLLLRVDGHLPVYHDIVSIEPWGAFGVNFQYNTKTATDGDPVPFSGANNLEFGLSVPVKISGALTLTGYVAYSHALTSLTETSPDTFWGGASLSLSF